MKNRTPATKTKIEQFYLKIINTVLNSDMRILKQIVWKNSKMALQFYWGQGGLWVIDQIMEITGLINKSRTTWPTKNFDAIFEFF